MSEDPNLRAGISDEPEYEVDPDLALAEQAEAPERIRERPHRRRTHQTRLIATIAAGGAIGGMCRYVVEELTAGPSGTFPWGTWIVNVSGCFLIGVLMIIVVDVVPSQRYIRPFLGVGLLGGYTTFSTFTVDTDKLVYDDHWGIAVTYAVTSLLAGLIAVYLGLVVGRVAAAIAPRYRTRRFDRGQ